MQEKSTGYDLLTNNKKMPLAPHTKKLKAKAPSNSKHKKDLDLKHCSKGGGHMEPK